MDSDTLGHIFEPFFSTKDKGTGLGLSTVYGIMKQNNGFINVYSELNVGTTFKIYFPAIMDKAEEISQIQEPTNFTGTETVLLVEDEAVVRRLAKRILEKHGYKVIEHESGGQAFVYFDEHADPVDLLLTDVIMPGINGKELHNRLKAKRPDLRVLFMSGYTEDVIGHHDVLDEGAHFIQKPFTIEILTREVRRVLDS
jgi:CheY-like chemotaxis protein